MSYNDKLEERPVIKRYTAQVGTENAAWLADHRDLYHGKPGFHDDWGITDNDDGTVTFDGDTLNALRDLPEHYDGSVDADRVMWIEGDGFPVTPESGQ